MASKRKGLGRDLAALLGNTATIVGPGTAQDDEALLQALPVDLIQPGKYQPRTNMHADTLQDLADSIKAQGVVQPIVVRPLGNSPADGLHYEIIAGERRWRAAQLAGLHEIPAVIREVPDRAAVAMALIENIQRENLNPLEEASALKRLIDEFEMTHQQASEAVGRSRAAVSNLLRLLDLAEEVKLMVGKGQLEMGHARALLALKGTQQIDAARRVVLKGLSVRETEQLVRRLQKGSTHQPRVAPRQDPNIRGLEQDLAEKLGAQVRVQTAGNGGGKVVISYSSLDELDGILSHIK